MATISNNDIKIRYVVETSNLEAAAQAFDKLSAEEKQALSELKKFNTETKATSTGLGNLSGVAAKAGGVIAGIFAVDKIVAFGRTIVETTAKFEQLRKAIDFASGSTAKGAENIQFLKDLTAKLGLDLISAAEGYKTFASSSNLAGVSIKETNRQFEAVSKAVAALGLSSEDAKGVFLALGQIISKGTVASEELRGQIGERLPGAFNIAAKAMGVTTAQLGKMLEKGEVASKDFLPKFATELENAFGTAANANLTTLTASQNKFNSAIDGLILAIGNKLQPFLKGAYDLAAGIATSLAQAAGAQPNKQLTENQISISAQKRIETELTKELFKLDQARAVKITAANIDEIRKKVAIQKFLEIEARIGNQLAKVADARVASAGSMSSRLQDNLIKQENELAILKAMEQQYGAIAAVQIGIDQNIKPEKTEKELKAEFDGRMRLLELEKQQLVLMAQIRGEKLGEVGAEKVFQEKVYGLRSEYSVKFIKLYNNEVDAAIKANDKITVDEKKALEKAKNEKVKLVREELNVNKLQRDRAAKDYEDAARAELLVTKEAKVQIAAEDKNLYDKRLAQMKEWQKAYEADLKNQIEKEKEAARIKEEIRQKAFELGQTFIQGGFDLYQANLSNEMSSIQRRYDEEIRLADGNQQKIDELNQQKAEKEKEIKTRQFKADQAAAVARIIFALGEQLIKYGANPATVPLAILAGSIAAAQIGFIAAQPVPEFAEGTKGKPFKGGKAIVGERGVEKVVTESGKVYFTPPTATLVDLPKGSQVIPNHALSKQELFMASHYASKSSSSSSPVVGEIRELGSIIKSLPITQLNMDERGFEKVHKNTSQNY